MTDSVYTFKVLSFESQQSFDELHASLIGHFKPEGPVENLFVLEMARSEWRMSRYTRLETAALNLSNTEGEAATRLHSGLTIGDNLRQIQRSEDAARRAYHRAHKELLAAQKQRTKQTAVVETRQPKKQSGNAKTQPPPALPADLRQEIDAHLRRDPFFDPFMDRSQLSAALRRWFDKHGYTVGTLSPITQ